MSTAHASLNARELFSTIFFNFSLIFTTIFLTGAMGRLEYYGISGWFMPISLLLLFLLTIYRPQMGFGFVRLELLRKLSFWLAVILTLMACFLSTGRQNVAAQGELARVIDSVERYPDNMPNILRSVDDQQLEGIDNHFPNKPEVAAEIERRRQLAIAERKRKELAEIEARKAKRNSIVGKIEQAIEFMRWLQNPR